MTVTPAESANWISVGALAESFASDDPSSNVLAPSPLLAGKTLALDGADGTEASYAFTSASELNWRIGAAAGTGRYLATSLRPGIFFVDFVRADRPSPASVSLVLDLNAGVATQVLGEMPDAETAHGGLLSRAQRQQELTVVATQITAATIDRPFDPGAALHRPTSELVGLRLQHRYNPHEVYEHIYLNAERYGWHCLAGIEKGLGDVDRCHYLKIAPDLYLFVWREKIVPTLGVVMIDLEQLKTTGKIFGYAGDDLSTISNFPVGAHSTILNRTEHRL